MTLTVISGGQTGADQGGLFAANALLIPCVGWVPKGWRTDAGPAPWLHERGLREHISPQYAPRTIANVRMSEAVIWFGNAQSPGGRLTHRTAKQAKLGWIDIPYPIDGLRTEVALELLPRWLYPGGRQKVQRLMIAGNRERTNPGIQEYVQLVMQQVLTEYIR